jgi:hypothetical protein
MLGGRTRARTWDPLIKSQLLYQLSYAPGTLKSGKAFVRAGRLAKRPPDVQQGNGSFPQSAAIGTQSKKPLDSSGFAELGSLEDRL